MRVHSRVPLVVVARSLQYRRYEAQGRHRLGRHLQRCPLIVAGPDGERCPQLEWRPFVPHQVGGILDGNGLPGGCYVAFASGSVVLTNGKLCASKFPGDGEHLY